jgi:mercuric ion transport protein
MKKEHLGLMGAFISATAATACCLPALLFLFFGVSVGFLGFLEYLAPLRIPFSLLSLFLLWFTWHKYMQKNLSCECANRKKYAILYALILVGLIVCLSYPEWTVLLLGDS